MRREDNERIPTARGFLAFVSFAALVVIASTSVRKYHAETQDLSVAFLMQEDGFVVERGHGEDRIEKNETLQADHRLALLMSFPNSGTSYTMTNVRRTSHRAVATNYDNGRMQPQLPTRDSVSPFLLDTEFEPPNLVLTKTHCTQYCERCVPSFDAQEFGEGCRSIYRIVNGEKVWDMYSEDLVDKAVHLFRSPFDNLVARMHLGIKRRRNELGWTEEQLAPFTESPAGMKAWCKHADGIFQGDMAELMRELHVPNNVWRNLPCHTDWLRWIMWHNMAIEYLDSLEIPVHVLYYEDYTKRYEETIRGLFDFLELEEVNKNKDFTTGKTYKALYDKEMVRLATVFVRTLASPKSWQLIKHYFAPSPVAIA